MILAIDNHTYFDFRYLPDSSRLKPSYFDPSGNHSGQAVSISTAIARSNPLSLIAHTVVVVFNDDVRYMRALRTGQ